MSGASQRRYGLGRKQEKILVISRPPTGVACTNNLHAPITAEELAPMHGPRWFSREGLARSDRDGALEDTLRLSWV